MSAREMPLMEKFGHGFLVLGGTNGDNEVVDDSWCFNAEKQEFEKLNINIDCK